jgi:integrase
MTNTPSAQTFSQLWRLYSTLRAPYLQPDTIRTFKHTKKFLLNSLPDKPAQEYTGLDLLQIVQQAIAKGRKPNGVNVNLRCLHSFGRWCAKQKLLPQDNPFANVELLKVTRAPIRYLSHEEFRKIFQAEKSQTMRSIYLVALLTGQRCGDVLRLTWENVDMSRMALRVRNSKTNRLNTIPLHPMLMEVLHDLGVKQSGPLFGQHFTPGYVSHRFLATARRAKVQDCTFHTLRKTFASWLALSGIGLHEIQKLLGHASVMLTERYYSALVASNMHGHIAKLAPVTGSVSMYAAEYPNPFGR